MNKLKPITIPGVKVTVEPVKDYRFALILDAPNLRTGSPKPTPSVVGAKPLPVEAQQPEAKETRILQRRMVASRSSKASTRPTAAPCGHRQDPGFLQVLRRSTA